MKTTLAINEIIEQWLSDIDIVEVTRYYYRRKLLLWFLYLSANKRDPRYPLRRDVIGYKQFLEEKQYSELTINGYVTVIKLFYKYTEEQNYYENIAAGIRSSRKYKGHRKGILTDETAAKLLESVNLSTEIGMRDKLMISLMLFYGLRTCEVERLNIVDFNKSNDRYLMRIQRKGRREKKEQVAVSRNVIDMMEEYTSCRNYNIEDPLFINHSHNGYGRRLCRKTITGIVKSRLTAAGIDCHNISAHSLRHTCATMLINSGVSLADVQDVLGHSDIATTRIYTSEAQREKLLKNSPSLLIETRLLNAIKGDNN